MTITLSGTKIHYSIQKAISLLKNSYKESPNSEEAGWYHYLDDPGIGASASATALYCYFISGQYFKETERVLRYLQNKQLISSDNTNGGWCIRTFPHTPIVEATVEVVYALGLNRNMFHANSPDLKLGYDWLVRNQNDDYGWGSYIGQSSRTYTTARSILALSIINRLSNHAALGADWLIRNRQTDIPAWGAFPGSPATVFHTALALLALASVPSKISETELVASLDWLENSLDPLHLTESLSQAEDYEIHFVDKGVPVTCPVSLAHFSTPVGVYALLNLSKKPVSSKICKAIQYIIDSQKQDGSWELPRNPNRPSIWAIWPCLAALNQFLHIPAIHQTTSITVIPGHLLTQASDRSLIRSLILLVSSSFWHGVKSNYGWLILFGFILTGVILIIVGIIGWLEFFLSLVFPVILLLIQLRMENKI